METGSAGAAADRTGELAALLLNTLISSNPSTNKL